jgi:pimeloyl-ACP methyl ester carboxylesterase
LLDVSTVDVIRDLVPGAEVVILENAGHLPIIETPDAAAAQYRAFLEENAR